MRSICLVFALISLSARAATFPASSTSRADVATAIGLASNGDTVTIPAGTSDWTTTLSITKAITLQGAGVGQTIITDGVGASYGLYLLEFHLVANLPSRMTAIEFAGGTNTTVNNANRLLFSGTNIDSRTMRVDHCKFATLIGPAMMFIAANGVVDHNTFIGKSSGVPAFIGHVKGNAWGGAEGTNSYGDGAWIEADQFGTNQFMFFENNTITNDYPDNAVTALDCQAGGRYVFRHNSMQGGSLETHGSEAARERSGRAFEVYNNTFSSNDVRSSPMFMRGGVGVVYSNTISGWTTAATFSLLDDRGIDHLFQPVWGSTGNNPWDKNNAGNPFATGTASSVGSLAITDNTKSWTTNQWAGYTVRRTSGKSVTSLNRSSSTVTIVATAHGFSTGNLVSVWGADQYGYNGLFSITVTDVNTFTFNSNYSPATPATGTIKCAVGNNFSLIISNTSTQLTFMDSGFGSIARLTFANADTFEIDKVDQAMDQVGVNGGSDLGGADLPTLWTNTQTASPWYEWSNTREGGADVDFSITRGGGGTFSVIVEGVNFINDTVKPGYTAYTYPHPLVTGTDYSTAGRNPSRGAAGRR